MISGFLKFHFCSRMKAPRTGIGSYLSSHNNNLAEKQDGSETRQGKYEWRKRVCHKFRRKMIGFKNHLDRVDEEEDGFLIFFLV